MIPAGSIAIVTSAHQPGTSRSPRHFELPIGVEDATFLRKPLDFPIRSSCRSPSHRVLERSGGQGFLATRTALGSISKNTAEKHALEIRSSRHDGSSGSSGEGGGSWGRKGGRRIDPDGAWLTADEAVTRDESSRDETDGRRSSPPLLLLLPSLLLPHIRSYRHRHHHQYQRYSTHIPTTAFADTTTTTTTTTITTTTSAAIAATTTPTLTPTITTTTTTSITVTTTTKKACSNAGTVTTTTTSTTPRTTNFHPPSPGRNVDGQAGGGRVEGAREILLTSPSGTSVLRNST
ncbi:hypothetical protein V1477_019327 [Vespula maculifrons]|uniref:Uncharacterized protein n=1 Tax=Vespula maculifrons TaxID=7453 RepID=A0ABD2ASA4_VESMC